MIFDPFLLGGKLYFRFYWVYGFAAGVVERDLPRKFALDDLSGWVLSSENVFEQKELHKYSLA